jgi:hypothetical protein
VLDPAERWTRSEERKQVWGELVSHGGIGGWMNELRGPQSGQGAIDVRNHSRLAVAMAESRMERE